MAGQRPRAAPVAQGLRDAEAVDRLLAVFAKPQGRAEDVELEREERSGLPEDSFGSQDQRLERAAWRQRRPPNSQLCTSTAAYRSGFSTARAAAASGARTRTAVPSQALASSESSGP